MGKEVTFCEPCKVFFISEDFHFHHLSGHHNNKAVQHMVPEYSLSIEKLSPETEIENIYDYFCNFGAVKAVKVDKKGGNSAILEFYNKSSVDAILNGKEFHVLNGMNLVVRNYELKHNGGRPLESPAPYHLLMKNLKYFTTIDDQVMYLSSSLCLSEYHIRMRTQFLHSLKRMLLPFFPLCSLHLFGSSRNGYGIKGCDVDILFQANSVMPAEHPGTRLNKNQILSMSPSVGEVSNGKFSLNSLLHLPRVVQLHFIMRVLRRHRSEFHTVVFVNAQTCPIVKLVSNVYGFSCDISNGNRLSLFNSALLSVYGKLDSRVVPLMTLSRYLGKRFGYISTRSFSSYAFSLLVIFFLQTRTPTVLPSVNFLRSRAASQTIEDGFDCTFCSDVNVIGRSENFQTLESLLIEFFDYYGNFDFEKFAIVPLHGQCEPKSVMCENKGSKKKERKEVNAVYIQDPFWVSRNVASRVKEKLLCNMKHHFQSIVKEYHDHPERDKLPLARSCETVDNVFWGIPELFDVIPEFVISSAVGKELSRSIEIELSATVLNSVKKQYGIKCIHCVEVKEICMPVVVSAVIEIMSCGLFFTFRVHDTPYYTELLRKRKSLTADCSCETSQKCIDSKAGTLSNLKIKLPNSSDCSESEQKPFLTVEVTVPHRTWKYREKYYANCVRGEMCPLEYERCISQKIITLEKSKMKTPAEIVCQFYKSNQKGNSVLLIKVKPNKHKRCWQQISTFLSSYLPKLIGDIL